MTLFSGVATASSMALILELLLKGTVVLVVAALVTLVQRRASAASRHLTWSAALVALLLLIVARGLGPAWILPIAPTGFGLTAASPLSEAAAPPAKVDRAPVVGVTIEPTAGLSAVPPPTSHSRGASPAPLAQGLLALWLCGALFLVVRLGRSQVALARLARAAQPVRDARILAQAREIARELGLDRPVLLLQSQRPVVPMTWGLLRPTILIPSAATGWSDDRARIVLTHELGHILRGDILIHWVGQLTLALTWPHPLVWLAVRRERAERERACDDIVLRQGARPSDYATELLGFASGAGAVLPEAGASLAMAGRSEFQHRLLAILDAAAPRSGATRLAFLFAGLALIGTALFAVLRPVESRALGKGIEQIEGSGSLNLNGIRLLLESWSGNPKMSARAWLDSPDCRGSRPGRTKCSVTQEDRTTLARFVGSGIALALDAEGEFDVSGDARSFASLAPGGWIVVLERRAGVEHEYRIRRGRDGGVTESCRREGVELSPSATQSWLATTVPELVRHTGLGLATRLSHLADHDGLAAALAEVRLVVNGAARSQALLELIDRPGLSEDDRLLIIDAAAVAPVGVQASPLFERALEEPSPRVLARVAQAALGLNEEVHRFTLLSRVVEVVPPGTPLPPALLAGLKTFHADHYRVRLGQSILERGVVAPDEALAVAEMALQLHSDQEKLEILRTILDAFPEPDAQITAALRRLADSLRHGEARDAGLRRLGP